MNDVAITDPQRQTGIIHRFADRYHVEPAKLLSTLKATAFKQRDGSAPTNEQMMALMVVADQYNLNPFTREIYAFPDKGGITPVVGVDGWARIINQHPQFDGMDFEQDAESCTCTIYRKDRSHPIVVTEYMSECARGTQPWQSHPRRMLRHKAMIQCARIAFSFAGIFDPDEAEAIVEHVERDVVERDVVERKEPMALRFDDQLGSDVVVVQDAQPADEHHEPAVAPIGAPTVTPQQLRILIKALERKGIPSHTMADAFGVADLEQLPAASINDAIQWISQQGVVAVTVDADGAV